MESNDIVVYIMYIEHLNSTKVLHCKTVLGNLTQKLIFFVIF